MKYFRKRTAKTNTFWPWCWLYNGFFIKKFFFCLTIHFFMSLLCKKGAWTPWFHPPYLVLIIAITLATNRVWVFEHWWNHIFLLKWVRDFGSVLFLQIKQKFSLYNFLHKERNDRKLAKSICLAWKLML